MLNRVHTLFLPMSIFASSSLPRISSRQRTKGSAMRCDAMIFNLYQGLGIVLTGGLTFSTIMTPTVVPALMGLLRYMTGTGVSKDSSTTVKIVNYEVKTGTDKHNQN